jgi:hypothetical protein
VPRYLELVYRKPNQNHRETEGAPQLLRVAIIMSGAKEELQEYFYDRIDSPRLPPAHCMALNTAPLGSLVAVVVAIAAMLVL